MLLGSCCIMRLLFLRFDAGSLRFEWLVVNRHVTAAGNCPRQTLSARMSVHRSDSFVGNARAITDTGAVGIARGRGSQLSGRTSGARCVIWVAGTRQICPTLSDAMAKVRGY